MARLKRELQKLRWRWTSIKDEIRMIKETLLNQELSWFTKRVCIKVAHKCAKEYRKAPY